MNSGQEVIERVQEYPSAPREIFILSLIIVFLFQELLEVNRLLGFQNMATLLFGQIT